MNTKRIVILFLAVLVITFGILLLIHKNKKSEQKLNIPIPTATPGVEERLEARIKGISIPDDVDRIVLTNVSEIEAMGIATKTEVIADLPEIPVGEYYQVFLGNGAKTISLGNLKSIKGGWILNYNISGYPKFNQIIITRNGKHILEGQLKFDSE